VVIAGYSFCDESETNPIDLLRAPDLAGDRTIYETLAVLSWDRILDGLEKSA
jgi:hypothetical protein